jgi:outer membrane protein assembly factor BamB
MDLPLTSTPDCSPFITNPLRCVRVAIVGRLLAVIGCCLAVNVAVAGDWPQILGPHRNGQADGEHLAAWPATGPRTVWEKPMGSGFAGPAVAGGRLVIFHRLAGDLVTEALDAVTGKQQWKIAFPTRYTSTISSDDGPRCVPLIHERRVYLLGPGGEMACVDFASGKQIWSRQVCQEFKSPSSYFGAGSSPIVEGDKLLLNVGGAGGAGIVALALDDGHTIWTATDEGASYSSPVAATIDGVRQVVFVTRLNVVSLDPQSGAVRFRFPFGARGPTVNAANPLVLGDHLFVSASYGVGAQWAKITPRGATKEWGNDDVMSSQYSTCVEKDGLLYGIDGRQDVGGARLRCFNPATGKILWTEENFGTGNLILADGKLLIMKTDGELLLVNAAPRKYSVLASARVFDNTSQALAALSDGRLFVRDTKTLKCLAVGPLRAASR